MSGCASSSSSYRILFLIEYDFAVWYSGNAVPSTPKSKLSCDFPPAVDAFACIDNVYSPTDNVVIKKLHCRRRRRRRCGGKQRSYIDEEKEEKIGAWDSVVNDQDIACSNTIQDDEIDRGRANRNKVKTWSVDSRRLHRLFLCLLLYLLFFSLPSCMAQQLDCCLPENADNGIGCTAEGTLVGGEKYLCVSINSNDCLYCNKRVDIDVSQCATGCVEAKFRYFCSGRFDPSTRHAVFGSSAATQHATEIAQHPLGDVQFPQLRGTRMIEPEN